MTGSKLQRRTVPATLFPSLARDMDQFQANVRRMFENPLSSLDAFSTLPQPIGWVPAVEISNSPTELTLTAELAGVDPKDVHLQVDGDALILRGEKEARRTEGDEGTEYYVVERNYGSFERAFTLPSNIDAAKIKANFERGLLIVHMPKTAASTPRGREIPIGEK